jgi:DNA-binding transcriptional regulator YdaS (Cro superfamily)
MSTSRTKRGRGLALEALVEHFGTQAALAEALGCTDGAVRGWLSDRRVPWGRACQIEIATQGAWTAESLGVKPVAKAGRKAGKKASK